MFLCRYDEKVFLEIHAKCSKFHLTSCDVPRIFVSVCALVSVMIKLMY